MRKGSLAPRALVTQHKSGPAPRTLTHSSRRLLLCAQQGEPKPRSPPSPATLDPSLQTLSAPSLNSPSASPPPYSPKSHPRPPHSLGLPQHRSSRPQHPLTSQHPLFQGPSAPQTCPATTSAAPADPPRWLTAATSPVSGSARIPASSSSLPPWWSPCQDPSSAPSPRTPPLDPPHQLPWAATSAPRECPSPPVALEAGALEAWAASLAEGPATPAKDPHQHP